MAKNLPKLSIKLNLLKPQGTPEQIFTRLVKWLLSTGRFIFIFVEALVLIAFIARFKLDADIASRKEAIEQQIPYIQSLKAYEILIRQTQLKLATIDSAKVDSANFAEILKKISSLLPQSIKTTNISLSKNVSQVQIQIAGQAQNNNDLTVFFQSLKSDSSFSNVNFASVGFENNLITFSITANYKALGGTNL